MVYLVCMVILSRSVIEGVLSIHFNGCAYWSTWRGRWPCEWDGQDEMGFTYDNY